MLAISRFRQNFPTKFRKHKEWRFLVFDNEIKISQSWISMVPIFNEYEAKEQEALGQRKKQNCLTED